MLFGVTRKQGTKARGEVLITGKADTTIPAGAIVLKTDSTKYQLLYDTTIAFNGKAVAEVECLEVGEVGNCAIGEIVNFEIANADIFTVTNEKAFTNGYEKEPNDSLIARAKERILKPAHSGNIYDYEKWAKEIDGVGKVLVEPLWNGNGTVRVRISNYNNTLADSELIRKVKKRIEQIDGRPVGADVTVASFDGKNIAISVSVILSPGTKLNTVTDLISSKIKQMIKDNSALYTLNNKEILSINRVEKIALSIDGVEDCKVLINNDSKNITVDSNEILIVTGVVINEQ
nr:MAG TPA: Baseplate J like protein [Caudoviricetes sp.]